MKRARLIPAEELAGLCFAVYGCARARCAYHELVVHAWTASSGADIVAVKRLAAALLEGVGLYRAAERKRRAAVVARSQARSPVRDQRRLSPTVASLLARRLTARCVLLHVQAPPALRALCSRLNLKVTTAEKPDRYFAEIGKRWLAAQYLAEHPEAPNVAVAKAVGVSSTAIAKWMRNQEFIELREAAIDSVLANTSAVDIVGLLREIEHRALLIEAERYDVVRGSAAKRAV